MSLSLKQVFQAISEESGDLSHSSLNERLSNIISQIEESCLENIPILDQPVIRQRRFLKNSELNFIFARPSFGFGRDLEWKVEINQVCARVAIESGDYNPSLFGHLKKVIQDRFLAFLVIIKSAQVSQSKIEIYINKKSFPINDFYESLKSSPVYKLEGDIFHFAIEISVLHKTSENEDFFEWLLRSIKVVAPIFHMVAPSVHDGEFIQEDANFEQYSEGSITYRRHLARERDPRVILKAKEKFKLAHDGHLYCEICRFNFFKTDRKSVV